MTYHTLFPRYVRTPFWLAVVIMAVVLVANVATCGYVRGVFIQGTQIQLTPAPQAAERVNIEEVTEK